jgi:hypothetical protein
MLGIRTYIDRAIRQIAASFEPVASAERNLGGFSLWQRDRDLSEVRNC